MFWSSCSLLHVVLSLNPIFFFFLLKSEIVCATQPFRLHLLTVSRSEWMRTLGSCVVFITIWKSHWTRTVTSSVLLITVSKTDWIGTMTCFVTFIAVGMSDWMYTGTNSIVLHCINNLKIGVNPDHVQFSCTHDRNYVLFLPPLTALQAPTK